MFQSTVDIVEEIKSIISMQLYTFLELRKQLRLRSCSPLHLYQTWAKLAGSYPLSRPSSPSNMPIHNQWWKVLLRYCLWSWSRVVLAKEMRVLVSSRSCWQHCWLRCEATRVVSPRRWWLAASPVSDNCSRLTLRSQQIYRQYNVSAILS